MIQPLPDILCQPASTHWKPRNRRIGSQNSPAARLENRNRVKAGPSTWTSVAPGSLRYRNMRTMTARNKTQKAIVAPVRTVALMLSGVNQGFSIQNRMIAARIPRPVTSRRLPDMLMSLRY